MKKFKRTLVVAIATLFAAACSSDNLGATTTSSSVVTTTSIPARALNPVIELEALAQKVNAADFSRISINHDGMFAVILRDKRKGGVTTVGTFTFWRWDGKVWNDVSSSIIDRPLDPAFFEPGSGIGGTLVTSYDLNADGVIDYLVEFNDREIGLNHPIGSILSNRGGAWHWESIMSSDGSISQAGQELSYFPDSKSMSMRDYPPDCLSEDVTVIWDEEREMFVSLGEKIYGD
jgi:hypothetical protein